MNPNGYLATISGKFNSPTAAATVSPWPSNTNSAVLSSLALNARQSSDTTAAPPLKGEKCRVQGCKRKGLFRSAYESKRHNQTVHGGKSAKRFLCSAKGCFKGQVPWSFARSDKLTSHIKTTHTRDTTFMKCPIANCSFGPSTLEVLGVHIQHVHQFREEGRAVLYATPCTTLKCPLWRCGKHVSVNKLLDHVKNHPASEIEAAVLSLESEGLLVRYSPKHDIKLLVACPSCGAVSADVEHFVKHLMTDHLLKPQSGGSEHFEKWISSWARVVPKGDRGGIGRADIQKLLPWSRIDRFAMDRRTRDYRCPSCSFIVMDVGGHLWFQAEQKAKQRSITEHHLSLLRPEAEVVAELYPHRMAILRLYPEFVTHPVFADFDQPQQQSDDGLLGVQAPYADHVNDVFEIPEWTVDNFDAFM